jgi:hypothetical protein
MGNKTGNPPLNIPKKRFTEWRGLIDGLLLGDGSVGTTGKFTMAQCESKRLGDGTLVEPWRWLLLVQERFHSLGLKTSMSRVQPTARPMIDGRPIRSGPSWWMRSEVRPELKEERERWYPQGKKSVPQDLVLTPETIAHWICGDGSAVRTGGFYLHTQCFTRQECERLVTLLYPARFRVECAGRNRSQYVLQLSRVDDAYNLAREIKPYMPESMLYKLRFVHKRKPRWKVSPESLQEAIAMYEDGCTLVEVAEHFGVTHQSLSARFKKAG